MTITKSPRPTADATSDHQALWITRYAPVLPPSPALGYLLPEGGEARVAKLRLSVESAAALHRRAAAVADGVPPPHFAQQHELAGTLRAAAATLAPGWLGTALDAAMPPKATPGGFVRIGQAQPLDDASFPAIVPLLGTGHLALNA